MWRALPVMAAEASSISDCSQSETPDMLTSEAVCFTARVATNLSDGRTHAVHTMEQKQRWIELWPADADFILLPGKTV